MQTDQVSNVELGIEATSYQILQLRPSSEYSISVISFQQKAPPELPDEGPVPRLGASALDTSAVGPEGQIPEKIIPTMGPIRMWVSGLGEDSVVLTWAKPEPNPHEVCAAHPHPTATTRAAVECGERVEERP